MNKNNFYIIDNLKILINILKDHLNDKFKFDVEKHEDIIITKKNGFFVYDRY